MYLCSDLMYLVIVIMHAMICNEVFLMIALEVVYDGGKNYIFKMCSVNHSHNTRFSVKGQGERRDR